MVFVLINDILGGLTDEFRSLSVRINSVETLLQEKFIEVYTHLAEPEKTEILLKQRDVKGVSVLQYLAKLKLHSFLQITHINRIIRGMWHSKTDISGSIFELASCYSLCFQNDMIENKVDTEVRLRFKCGKAYSEVGDYKPMPHYMTKSVWLRSMSVRFFIETIIFFGIVVFY